MKGKAFIKALNQLESEKGISKEQLLQTIELALFAAYKKNYGEEQNPKIEINRKTGDIKIFTIKTAVEEVLDENKEILLNEAREIDKTVNLQDEVYIEQKCNEFRRNAVQNAKQIVIQKVRETERDNLYNEFNKKIGTIINGIIRRIDERGNIYIDFNEVEAILPTKEQSILDRYIVGNRIKVYVEDVIKSTKFPKIIISRKSEELLKSVFELEIPEIEEGTIVIKSIVREAGSRAKVAVFSENSEVDTIGACIGQNGSRIKMIVEELKGEKIDIIKWKEKKEEFISNALSPAKITRVNILENNKEAKVIVPKEQLSLAIGKNGQNVRLAAKLTGMKIDIKTEEEVNEDVEL
ncbi:MAG: transcription termination/antitermination protein NusA [Fusobacteriia bacterium 4572_132]|nr:MAG: transcription termination/antitermination protein NusA [Fusobacteriia bacterium 4572_132]